ncbi:hypothetical protein [Spirosoma soli]
MKKVIKSALVLAMLCTATASFADECYRVSVNYLTQRATLTPVKCP